MYKFNGKCIPVIQTIKNEGFTSLSTFKKVKGIKRNGHIGVDIGQIRKSGSGPYVYGTNDQIHLFIEENFKSENRLQPKSLELVKAPQQKVVKSKSFMSKLFSKFSSCITSPRRSNTQLKSLKDVENISDDVFKSMSYFHLGGLEGKGKVVDVTDGDTIKMGIYVPLFDLAKEFEVNKGRGKNRKLVPQRQILYNHENDLGFFTVVPVRLLGVDTAEKHTEEGKVAKDMVTKKYDSLNNIVYYKISHSREKFGRVLATLYEDPLYTISINEFILNMKPENGVGVIVEAYFGGTKSDYMKGLPSA